MKNFKRIQSMFLAVIMAVVTFGSSTAFAAGNTSPTEMLNTESITTYETLIQSENRTISTTSSAAGSTFMPGALQIRFVATFASGSNRIVAIRLHQYLLGNDVVVKEWQSSNGTISDTINVVINAGYCFEYLLASGSQVTVYNNIYRIN